MFLKKRTYDLVCVLLPLPLSARKDTRIPKVILLQKGRFINNMDGLVATLGDVTQGIETLAHSCCAYCDLPKSAIVRLMVESADPLQWFQQKSTAKRFRCSSHFGFSTKRKSVFCPACNTKLMEKS